MNISIRKFLLINLLLAITITTTLTAVGNYYLDQPDINDHLDSLMALAAKSYEVFLGEDFHDRKLNQIQAKLDSLPAAINRLEGIDPQTNDDPVPIRYTFQAYNKAGKLLLNSPPTHKHVLVTAQDGFSDKLIKGELWRTFVTTNHKTGIRTVVASRYDLRNELSHRIAQDDIYIMLLTFPLSGLLIWIIIGRGLGSLARVTSEVAHREPSHLEPVSSVDVPLEIKPLVDELNRLFARLKEAFEREKRFAADAAHELRTPLAALKTQAEVALKTNDQDERVAIIENVIAGVNRSSHIIQQLLTLSRIVPEATHLEETSHINLQKLAAEIIAQLAPFAISKKIDLELATSQRNNRVTGNLTALSILIRNLVDNAIRYTNDGGKVHVEILSEPKHIILRVTDTGPGIPAELRERVFERFFRVIGNKSPGSGLGLAIVRQIAKLHGAEVKLTTPEDETGLQVDIVFNK